MCCTVHVSCKGVTRNAYKFLARNPHRNISHRRRCENNVKMVIRLIKCEEVDWIELAEDSYNGRLLRMR